MEPVGSVDGDDGGVENEREGDGGGEPSFFRVEVFITMGGFQVMGFLTTNFYVGGFQTTIFLRLEALEPEGGSGGGVGSRGGDSGGGGGGGVGARGGDSGGVGGSGERGGEDAAEIVVADSWVAIG